MRTSNQSTKAVQQLQEVERRRREGEPLDLDQSRMFKVGDLVLIKPGLFFKAVVHKITQMYASGFYSRPLGWQEVLLMKQGHLTLVVGGSTKPVDPLFQISKTDEVS